MKTRDVVLITILSCGAVVAIVALAAYIYIRRRRRKRDDEDGTSCAIRADSSSTDGGGQKTSRLNGFLNLKTPLISTKTLGAQLETTSTSSPQAKSPAGSSAGACAGASTTGERTPTAHNKQLHNVKGQDPPHPSVEEVVYEQIDEN